MTTNVVVSCFTALQKRVQNKKQFRNEFCQERNLSGTGSLSFSSKVQLETGICQSSRISGKWCVLFMYSNLPSHENSPYKIENCLIINFIY